MPGTEPPFPGFNQDFSGNNRDIFFHVTRIISCRESFIFFFSKKIFKRCLFFDAVNMLKGHGLSALK